MQPLFQRKSNKYYIFWVGVSSLRYPVCNVRAPYCHLLPVWLYSVFPQYFLKGTIFEKKLLNIKCVFWFSLTTLVWNISHSKKWARYNKNVYWSSCKVFVILFQILLRLEFFWRIFAKYSNIKFHENPPSWIQLCHAVRQINRHDKANTCFHNFTKVLKKVSGNWMAQIFYK